MSPRNKVSICVLENALVCLFPVTLLVTYMKIYQQTQFYSGSQPVGQKP